MSIEEYMNNNTYSWTLYSEFEKDGFKYFVVTEYTPTGEESDLYMLLEKDGKIFNILGDMIDNGLEKFKVVNVTGDLKYAVSLYDGTRYAIKDFDKLDEDTGNNIHPEREFEGEASGEFVEVLCWIEND